MFPNKVGTNKYRILVVSAKVCIISNFAKFILKIFFDETAKDWATFVRDFKLSKESKAF